ncbi:hypothetical protein BS50DRAFT_612528 [Corynespora cassiicola Philippines]|uniref:Wax synthase domain-containing protein n=1 Tax=Corynespora cassiicola Philippines TaxID=1448308 RepID=A0A2T2ND26_CORCC|nr:hypothetical protein BS50DRAFT_612528 [Corynespora cassiicola Philippines]
MFSLPGSLTPIFYFALSSATFLAAVRLQHFGRLCLAPILLGSAVLSLTTSTRLSWVYPGVASYWNLLQCVWMHHAASVLYIDRFRFPNTCRTTSEAWLLAYKIYNDPQRQLDWPDYLPNRNGQSTSWRKRYVFALLRAAKVTLCWMIQLHVIGPAVISHFRLSADDFAPSRHALFGRLLRPQSESESHFTMREIQFRSVMSVYWIWLAYLMLDGANVVLSIFFVTVARLDAPEEWPPLFGSPWHGSSIRGFWGKFWHRLAGPSCASSAKLITHHFLRLESPSRGEKMIVAFWTFFVSGVIHAVADWQGGETVMPAGELQFWLSNFAAGAIEVLFMTAAKRLLRNKNGMFARSLQFQATRKIIGFIWVFAFFFWAVPAWQYPKFYEALKPLTYDTTGIHLFSNLGTTLTFVSLSPPSVKLYYVSQDFRLENPEHRSA